MILEFFFPLVNLILFKFSCYCFFGILILFCSGAIERTAAGRSSTKSDNCTEDAVFSFLFCSSASSAIERTNL
jgi:hypothetical protein